MSFDDDKVRKNLVVAGATVIATHYLGLPIYDIFIDKLDLGKYLVDRLHLTQIGLAIFVYLGLMFRFSEVGQNYSTKVEEDGAKIAKARAIKWARGAIMQYLKKGVMPRWLLKPVLLDGFSELLERRPPDVRGWPHHVFVYTASGANFSGPTHFYVDVSIDWTPDLNAAGNAHSRGTTVDLTLLGTVVLRAVTFFKQHFYTETAVMVLLPVLLGNAAVILMVYRLLRQYFGNA